MRRAILFYLPALLAGALTLAADTAPGGSSHLDVPRVPRVPTLEDFLSMRPAPDLEGALAHTTGLVQREPEDGQPASQKTDIYLGYDEHHLYVIWVAFDDEPDKMRAHVSRRENVFGDEIVELQLDTFLDQRRAYTFIANPHGVQWDAIYSEGRGGGSDSGSQGGGSGSFDSSWDTVWQSEGRLTDRGYVVRMAIPFRSLRFPPTEEQTWGVILLREIPRNNENSLWPAVTTRIEGRLNQAGTLGGLRGVSPGHNSQVIPYVTSRSFRALDENTVSFAEDGFDPDTGVDAKFVFRDSLALDLTANPDFSQVESDQPQITVNERFEVRFPEKRPFFLENTDFFSTPINLVFTRRIADPSGGARLTGKVGKYSLGALFVDDTAPGKTVDPDDPLFDELDGERAWFGVLRLTRDISQQSKIGLLFTDREFGDGYNRVGGIDGRIKMNDNWVTTFHAAHSVTRSEEGERTEDPAFDVAVDRQGRNYIAHHHVRDIGREFATETGFVNRTDLRDVHTSQEYRFWKEGTRLMYWAPEIRLARIEDHGGTRLDWRVTPEIKWQFRRQTRVELFGTLGKDRLRPEDLDEIVEPSGPDAPPVFTEALDFDRREFGIDFASRFINPVNLEVRLSRGRSINLVPAEDRPPAAADETRGNVALTLRPGTRGRVETRWLFTRLTDRATDQRILSNHIVRTRFDWQFSPRFSLRSILQYDRTTTDPMLTRLETTKNLNLDLLLTYLVNPWTALYVGYNANYQNLEVLQDPSGDRLVRTDDDFLKDGRQLFVKFSYLFRL